MYTIIHKINQTIKRYRIPVVNKVLCQGRQSLLSQPKRRTFHLWLQRTQDAKESLREYCALL